MTHGPDDPDELTPDELQLAFHEVECHDYDERFGISYGHAQARDAATELEALVGPKRYGRILDVGCGTGYAGLGLVAAGVAEEAILVDLSPGMLDRARSNAAAVGDRTTFLRASAASLPLADASVDAVVTRGVLHHLHDPVAALTEWRRVVAADGPVVLLSEPAPNADRVGGAIARATLAGLAGARRLASGVGRPLPSYPADEAQQRRFWDLVAMAANLHTFTPEELSRLGRDAGFAEVSVRGGAATSIAWASAYYVLAGELPPLTRSRSASRLAGRVHAALRRFDARVVERVIPPTALLTVRGVMAG